MSHIIEINVNGLAGRKKPLRCTLDRHINVFYGLNGSGKTSLIKILHSAMSGDSSVIRNVPFTSATVQIYSINYDRIFTRKFKREQKDKATRFQMPAHTEYYIEDSVIQVPAIQYRFDNPEFANLRFVQKFMPEWVQEPSEAEPLEGKGKGMSTWRHRYLPTTRLHILEGMAYPFPGSPKEQILTEEQLDAVFAESIERLWSNYASDLLVAVRGAQEEGLTSILQAILAPSESLDRINHETVGAKEAYGCLKNFLERQGSQKLLGGFRKFQKRYDEEAAFKQVVADIQKVELRIQQTMAPRDKLQSLIERLYTGGKHVSFGDKSVMVDDYDRKPISLASLSSGEKHLMRILVDTLIAEDNTIMIDEPEISLHIDWQRELLATMHALNPRAQFIVATHSPEIMANVPDERIIEL